MDFSFTDSFPVHASFPVTGGLAFTFKVLCFFLLAGPSFIDRCISFLCREDFLFTGPVREISWAPFLLSPLEYSSYDVKRISFLVTTFLGSAGSLDCQGKLNVKTREFPVKSRSEKVWTWDWILPERLLFDYILDLQGHFPLRIKDFWTGALAKGMQHIWAED